MLRNYLMSRLMAFVSSMERRDTKNLVVSADLKIECGSVLMGRVGHSVSQRPSSFCSIILSAQGCFPSRQPQVWPEVMCPQPAVPHLFMLITQCHLTGNLEQP